MCLYSGHNTNCWTQLQSVLINLYGNRGHLVKTPMDLYKNNSLIQWNYSIKRSHYTNLQAHMNSFFYNICFTKCGHFSVSFPISCQVPSDQSICIILIYPLIRDQSAASVAWNDIPEDRLIRRQCWHHKVIEAWPVSCQCSGACNSLLVHARTLQFYLSCVGTASVVFLGACIRLHKLYLKIIKNIGHESIHIVAEIISVASTL